jgi:hypothetical protein
MKLVINAIDNFRWAKILKSDHALWFLSEGAKDDQRLEKILHRQIELGNVVEHGNGYKFAGNVQRDEFGRLSFER